MSLRLPSFWTVLALHLLVVAAVILLASCQHRCLRSHRGIVHHDAYAYLIWIDDSAYPIYVPARDAVEDVCDERAP